VGSDPSHPGALGRAAAQSGSDPSRIRLFVALDLPDAARAALAALEPDPEIWRRLAPEQLHVTLAFLGPRPREDVETIGPIIEAEAGGPAPSLSLARVLLLPPRRARVLTVALDGELSPLQARVSQTLAEAGVYTPEKRPYRAHVTVARLRPRTPPQRETDLSIAPLHFEGRAITLYASRLHPNGARYEPLVTAPLAGR
jgi:2'-5' RNA ligase